MNKNTGILVRGDNTGLGIQTKRYVEMLKPSRILYIDSTSFNGNKQNFNWYKNFNGYKVQGFPTNHEIDVFLKGLTHVLVAENPMNYYLPTACLRKGIKLYIASNYEFCDHLNRNLDLPEMFLMPSYWKIKEMKEKFGDDKVMYLPPPINPNDFKEAREMNLVRTNQTPRFLHIVGTLAVNDRNGTLDLLNSLRYSQENFELVIRSQRDLPSEYYINDKRVKYIIEDIKDVQDMYSDFDALILPRRYGGLSLTTNEALISALPVIMSDISPNNELLPKKWLVKGAKTGEFFTRTMIDIHTTYTQQLGEKLDWLCRQDLNTIKLEAFNIGYEQFSETRLKPKYEQLWKQ